MSDGTQLDLTRLRKNLSENGYSIESAILSADDCDHLCEISHSWDNFKSEQKLSVMNPHQTDTDFFSAFAAAPTLQRLRYLFDGKVSGIQSQLFYGPPGCAGYTAHQDNFFIQANPDFFVSVWIALEDAGPDNGGLYAHPGSHVLPILDVRDVPSERRGQGQDPNSDRVEAVFDRSRYPAQNLSVSKGDRKSVV